MSFNAKNYFELKEAFLQKHLAAIEHAEAKKAQLENEIPDLAEIDRELAATSSRIFHAILGGGADVDSRIAGIRETTGQLREARDALLTAHGYPADYTDPKYDCTRCKDLGFIDAKMCSCLREALILRGYETSGLQNLLAKQTFANFSLDYYADDPEAHNTMQRNLKTARTYAETFTLQSGSLLFLGGTGLGKTHLSTAIARAVLDRGYDVLYTAAQELVAAFENVKFHGAEDTTDRYLSAELLIVDDLGTELGGAFTQSCLYNLINTRLLRGLPTVINTNLDAAGLSERYGERIVSRLFGEYQPLLFRGRDIRMKKI